jgi:hypothetical protein
MPLQETLWAQRFVSRGGARTFKPPCTALFSDRDYVVLQVMLEESFHYITAGYAV